MKRAIAAAALVLWFAWPALAGLDSGDNSAKFRDADGIAAGPVHLVQSSQVVIDREEVAKDPALREAIKAHYKKARIYKRDSETMGGGDSRAFIEAFDRVEVVRVEGDVITVKMVFWCGSRIASRRPPPRAIASSRPTVRRTRS